MMEGTTPIRATRSILGVNRLTILGGLAVLLTVLVVGASLVGAYPLSLGDIAAAMGRLMTGARPAGQIDTVLFQVRMPRVLAAILVGAALSAAGATYQGLFRNPLVSPDILGVAAGAGSVPSSASSCRCLSSASRGSAFAGGPPRSSSSTASAARARPRPDPGARLAGVAWRACRRRHLAVSRCWPIPTTSCPRSTSGCSAA